MNIKFKWFDMFMLYCPAHHTGCTLWMSSMSLTILIY